MAMCALGTGHTGMNGLPWKQPTTKHICLETYHTLLKQLDIIMLIRVFAFLAPETCALLEHHTFKLLYDMLRLIAMCVCCVCLFTCVFIIV
jgi:hypothetical protein